VRARGALPGESQNRVLSMGREEGRHITTRTRFVQGNGHWKLNNHEFIARHRSDLEE
jgi:hypothetical protein